MTLTAYRDRITPVERLREAALRIRDDATAATPGPWVPHPTNIDEDAGFTVTRPYCGNDLADCDPDCGEKVLRTGAEGCEEDFLSKANAYHVAAWHPGVALAVVDLFEAAANAYPLDHSELPRNPRDRAVVRAAVTAAHAYWPDERPLNGETS